LSQDGKYQFSPDQNGGGSSESGKYWFENGEFLISDDFCPTPGHYTIQKVSDGDQVSLNVTVVQDDCEARKNILTSGLSTWVGP
jgi:hypothetical protein